jgi:LacI family transcriptional regulator
MVKNILPLGESYKGIILESPRVGSFPEELALLREQKLPMLNIAGFEKTPSACQCPCVFPDRKKAFLAGVEHLLRRGHRRIAFLLTLNWQKVQERLRIDEKEFVEQLEKLGLKKEQISIGFCDNNNPDDMIEQTIKLFSGKEPRPTAIFCDTDGIAAFAYEGLRRLELAIPEDVAVLGFVGCLANCLLKPGLSTVDFDYKRAAAFAVDLLLSPDYAGLPPVIYSPFDVVVRESTSVIRYEIERK